MKKYIKLILTGLFLVSVSACGTAVSNPTNNNVNTNNNKTVIMNVQIDKTALSDKKDVTVNLYNSENLKQLELTASCTTSYNALTNKETTSCPDGVVYKKVTPETFTFKFADIKDNVVVNSKTVKVGEKFRLNVSGLSKDNCNMASATVEQTATSAILDIKGLQWVSTELGCVLNPSN